jgi:hemolysin activation/secretion protein
MKKPAIEKSYKISARGNKKTLAVIAVLFISAFVKEGLLFGAPAPSREEYLQRQIIQQQQQEQDYRDNIRNILEIQKIKDSRQKEEEIPGVKDGQETPSIRGAEEENVYKFDKIELTGNKVFSYKKLQKAVLNGFIGKPIDKTNVSRLQEMLTDYYVKKGYAAVKVYFDPKQIKAAENKDTGKVETYFTLIIEEGVAGKIILNNIVAKGEEKSVSKIQAFRKSSRLFFAFPFLKGKAVDINAYEQGLDQMNKLQSNSATMDIKPSSDGNLAVSSSDIIIVNNQNPLAGGAAGGTRTTFLNANYNNGGSKSTGERVINLSVIQDNLLAINDNIYISYTENADSLFNMDKKDNNTDYGKSHNYGALDFFRDDEGKKRFSKSVYAAFSFPLGYWSFNSAFNYSNYKTSAQGQYNVFHVSGQTVSQTYSAERVLWRTKSYKLNMGSALEIKDAESYVRDVRSETGSSRKSSVSGYLNNVLYTKFGTLIIKPSYQKGLRWFGSKTDSDVYANSEIIDSDPRLQYDLLKMYIYFSAQFNIPLPSKNAAQRKSSLPLSYNLTIDSQYSFNSLYGAEQFSAGGQYTVRGFKDSVISGDNGFYIRNDLRINMLQALPDAILQKEALKRPRTYLFKESVNSLLSKTHLSLFYDFGYVANKYESVYDKQYDSQRGSMSGAGAALSFYGKYISVSFAYARALHNAAYLQERDELEKEEETLYWKIGANW